MEPRTDPDALKKLRAALETIEGWDSPDMSSACLVLAVLLHRKHSKQVAMEAMEAANDWRRLLLQVFEPTEESLRDAWLARCQHIWEMSGGGVPPKEGHGGCGRRGCSDARECLMCDPR